MEPTSSRLGLARARRALRSARLPHHVELERASSTRNEIYLSPQHVVRINRTASQRLRREADLYAHLPRHAWSPRLVGAGGAIGGDYLIVERKPGGPLAYSWPHLSPQSRKQAISQLATALKAIHDTPTPDDLIPLPTTPQLLDAGTEPPVRSILEGLSRLASDPNLDSGVVRTAIDYVNDHWKVLEGLPDETMIHGDLTFENILWDGSRISAIVDFEWSRGAPADLDLDVLLRCCALPAEHVAPDYERQTRAEDYADVPLWLAESYPELFAHPRLAERVMLYALSFEVGQLLEASTAACRNDRSLRSPYSRLVSLVSTGGHVATMLNRVGVAV